MKSGVVVKEIKGHASFVNKLLLIENNTQLLSAGADGTIKVNIYLNCCAS